MRKLLLLLAGTAVLCVPAVSVAANGSPSPAKLATTMCKALRTHDGNALFKQTYHSFAGCLKQNTSNAKQDVGNAAKTCKAQKNDTNFPNEAGHNGESFNQFYGTNTNAKGTGSGANAFGKCVSTIAKQNANSDVKDAVAAARTCRAAELSDAATFQSAYGTGRNPFGKCVSKEANAKQG